MIGCDVGTQSSKGLLVDADGRVRATASASHDVEFPAPGHAQQNPDAWTEAIRQILTQLASQTDGTVSHIAIAAQLDGIVPVDSALRPLHDALIWMDRRASMQAEHLRDKVGAERIFDITGLNCNASHTAPKMMWLRDQLGTPVAKFLPVGSFVNSWLTGVVAQDPANASSTMLYDVAERKWADELVDASELDPRTFPEVAGSTEVLGSIRPELADEVGLARDIEILTGTGDDHASAIGAGAVLTGIVADVTGTAEPIGMTTETPIFDPDHLVETHVHAMPDRWFIENPGFVSGGSVRWIAGLLGIDDSEVFDLAAEAPPASKGFTFIPALSGAMTPRWNDHMLGGLAGASMDQGRADLCRAVIEGCSFALRDIVDRLAGLGLRVDGLRVTGGGARSNLWLQIKADVTGVPVRAVAGEGAAMGAVCLASVAAGWFDNIEAASQSLVEVGPEIFEPETGLSGVYEAGYQRYRQVFDALESVYQP